MSHDTRPRRHTPLGRWLSLALAGRPERLTWKEIASQAGLSYSYLIQIKNGHETPSAETVHRLERVLQSTFSPAGCEPTERPPVDVGPGMHQVRVVLDPRLDGLVSTPRESLPVAPGADPEGTRFFLIAVDNGLAPAIPSGAFCLTNPGAAGPTAVSAPWALSLGHGAVIVRYVALIRGLYLIQTAQERRSDQGLHPLGRWMDRGQVHLWGRVEEVRYRLSDPPSPDRANSRVAPLRG